MNLTTEDSQLLEELCREHGVSAAKVVQLLEIVSKHQFKERRTGIYDDLREILQSKAADPPHGA